MLEIGIKAPEFTLNDKDGNAVGLSDFLGKKVVLYFYPKDNTPGCTRQACAFAAAYEGFKAKDIAVIGVSKDSVASHLKFAQKHDLPLIVSKIHLLQAFYIQCSNLVIAFPELLQFGQRMIPQFTEQFFGLRQKYGQIPYGQAVRIGIHLFCRRNDDPHRWCPFVICACCI